MKFDVKELRGFCYTADVFVYRRRESLCKRKTNNSPFLQVLDISTRLSSVQNSEKPKKIIIPSEKFDKFFEFGKTWTYVLRTPTFHS